MSMYDSDDSCPCCKSKCIPRKPTSFFEDASDTMDSAVERVPDENIEDNIEEYTIRSDVPVERTINVQIGGTYNPGGYTNIRKLRAKLRDDNDEAPMRDIPWTEVGLTPEKANEPAPILTIDEPVKKRYKIMELEDTLVSNTAAACAESVLLRLNIPLTPQKWEPRLIRKDPRFTSLTDLVAKPEYDARNPATAEGRGSWWGEEGTRYLFSHSTYAAAVAAPYIVTAPANTVFAWIEIGNASYAAPETLRDGNILVKNVIANLPPAAYDLAGPGRPGQLPPSEYNKDRLNDFSQTLQGAPLAIGTTNESGVFTGTLITQSIWGIIELTQDHESQAPQKCFAAWKVDPAGTFKTLNLGLNTLAVKPYTTGGTLTFDGNTITNVQNEIEFLVTRQETDRFVSLIHRLNGIDSEEQVFIPKALTIDITTNDNTIVEQPTGLVHHQTTSLTIIPSRPNGQLEIYEIIDTGGDLSFIEIINETINNIGMVPVEVGKKYEISYTEQGEKVTSTVEVQVDPTSVPGGLIAEENVRIILTGGQGNNVYNYGNRMLARYGNDDYRIRSPIDWPTELYIPAYVANNLNKRIHIAMWVAKQATNANMEFWVNNEFAETQQIPAGSGLHTLRFYKNITTPGYVNTYLRYMGPTNTAGPTITAFTTLPLNAVSRIVPFDQCNYIGSPFQEPIGTGSEAGLRIWKDANHTGGQFTLSFTKKVIDVAVIHKGASIWGSQTIWAGAIGAAGTAVVRMLPQSYTVNETTKTITMQFSRVPGAWAIIDGFVITEA